MSDDCPSQFQQDEKTYSCDLGAYHANPAEHVSYLIVGKITWNTREQIK